MLCPALSDTDEVMEEYLLIKKKEELLRLYPMLSDVEVIIMKKKVGRGPIGINIYENFRFVSKNVSKYFFSNIVDRSEVTFWSDEGGLYQFRRRDVDLCHDRDDDFDDYSLCGNDDYYSDDEESDDDSCEEKGVPEYNYVAIVEANKIHSFMRKSMEMKTEYYDVDPLDYGEYHETEVYVHSPTTIPPIGLSDLIDKSVTIHLVINEEIVDEFIEKIV